MTDSLIERVQWFREYTETLKMCVDKLGGMNSTADYNLRTLGDFIEWTVENLPIKVGDRVEFTADVSCEGAWKENERNMKAGCRGWVKGVDFHKTPYAYVMLDHEEYTCTWGDDKGKRIPLDQKHVFGIGLKKLKAIENDCTLDHETLRQTLMLEAKGDRNKVHNLQYKTHTCPNCFFPFTFSDDELKSLRP